MRLIFPAAGALALCAALPAQALVIDDFTTVTDAPDARFYTGGSWATYQGAGILGGERDISVGCSGGTDLFDVQIGGGSADVTVCSISLYYDGVDPAGSDGWAQGDLAPTDLTEGGASNAILVGSALFTGEGYTYFVVNLLDEDETRVSLAPTLLEDGSAAFLFSEAAPGFDLTAVRSIQLDLRLSGSVSEGYDSAQLGPLSTGYVGASTVPVPPALALMLAGLGALGGVAARRRRG